ncbi:MAG: hypothetical protein HN730_08890 [Bdellovibrionales bacterium]|nr:hypothetical protein [Bdellovibrionales bacterium]
MIGSRWKIREDLSLTVLIGQTKIDLYLAIQDQNFLFTFKELYVNMVIRSLERYRTTSFHTEQSRER